MIYKSVAPLFSTVVLALALLPNHTTQAQMAIAEPFRAYYEQHEGPRVLGQALTNLVEVDGVPAQYFEKGRIEDHRGQVADSHWSIMFGRLTAELIEHDPEGTVSGMTIQYRVLADAHQPASRVLPPAQFRAGATMTTRSGEFVPYDSQLAVTSGYIVPLYFWSYINRRDLFPGGWLHDIGLPMTGALQAQAVKNGAVRDIILQAFERAVLTFDPQNPTNWQVERANIGADALRTAPACTPNPIAIPASNAVVALPLHILAHVEQPGGQVIARVRWRDGTDLTQLMPVMRNVDGRGIVVGNLDWTTESQLPQPADRTAVFDLRSSSGELLARQPLQVLRWDDPDTQEIELAWLIDGRVATETRRVPRTVRIGTAALEELLWGPRPGSLAGFTTAIPTPEEVLRYPRRAPDWGPRVTLRNLVIDDGVATADFSQEMEVYGGGSARAQLIREQITRTLLQFPTVREVHITMEGQSEGVLQPVARR